MRTDGVGAPFDLLNSLYIRNDKTANYGYTKFGEFTHWNTPNLRRLTTENYFPLSLPGLANVTTLEINLLIFEIDFAVLLKELSRMRYLAYFTLKLDHYRSTSVEPIDTQLFERMELPSIRHLRVEIRCDKVHGSLLKPPLLSTLFFPGVVDLRVRLWGDVSKDYPEADDATLDLDEELVRTFRSIEQFPSVECFHLELHGDCIYADIVEQIESQRGFIELVIPLNMLPSIKHFTLRSNRHLLIKEEKKEDRRVPEDTFPAFETVTIETPDSRDVMTWISEILQKQKERGCWGEFRELVVVTVVDENKVDDKRKEKVTATYVGNAALAWCSESN